MTTTGKRISELPELIGVSPDDLLVIVDQSELNVQLKTKYVKVANLATSSINGVLSTPPVSPSTSEWYIVGENASDSWAGQEDALSVWNGSSWEFVSPTYGFTVFNKDTENTLVFTSRGWTYNGTSVFGRTGDVTAQSGDYTASQVAFTPVGNLSSTDVQAAIAELDSEKEPADSTILKEVDIGVTVQGYDATLLNEADIGVNVQAYDATLLNSADIGVTIQPYDVNTVVDAAYVHTDNNYTTTEKNKLAGIAEGAEVNVNADWDSVTGASQILNKPSTFPPSAHTHDAADITSGTIDIARLPASVIERLVIVADDVARFALTTATVQNGDVVKVVSTNSIYYVKDDNQLNSESGYETFSVGSAASVPWSGITDKPTDFPPSIHAHVISDITGLQTAMDDKLDDTDVGVTVQPYDANTVIDSAYIHTDNNYTTTEKNKLAGIQEGAEVNVNADWNAVSGDAEILNKPTFGTAATKDVAVSGDASSTEVVLGNDTRLTDARTPTVHTHVIADVTGLQTALNGKQDTLVSGTNIKTINGESLIGPGDISVSGAGLIGSPGGNTGEIQYNNAGSFAGAANVEIESGNLKLMPTTIPVAPADGLVLFDHNRAGRHIPSIIGPSGVDVALQPALFGNSIYMWLPGTGTTLGINFGTSFTARNSGIGAEQAHPTKTSTNAMTSLNRATFGTGITRAGASGIQSTATVAWRGNAAGLGGFFFHSRFGIETLAADMRAFVGLSANNADMADNPSSWANTIGIGKDSTDSTWQIISRSGSAVTKTPTDIAVTAGQVLDFMAFAAPNASKITVHVADAVTGNVLFDNTDLTTNLPTNTTFLYMQAHCQSVSGTTAKLLALNRMYCETDL